jgi:hypothetical protein
LIDPSTTEESFHFLRKGWGLHHGDETVALTAVRQRSALYVQKASLSARIFYLSCHRCSVTTFKIKQEDHLGTHKENTSYSSCSSSVWLPRWFCISPMCIHTDGGNADKQDPYPVLLSTRTFEEMMSRLYRIANCQRWMNRESGGLSRGMHVLTIFTASSASVVERSFTR